MQQPFHEIRSLDDLQRFVHRTLCQRENLQEDQFPLSVSRLRRGGRDCGLRFLLFGPRDVRPSAVWTADRNEVYFYDAGGQRFGKAALSCRLAMAAPAA